MTNKTTLDRKIRIQINTELCDGCGQCVNVCPSETISLKDKKARITGNESLTCGHCIAACPNQAIDLINDEFSCVEFNTFTYENKCLKYGEFNTSDLVRFMLSRRSCRNFKDIDIDRNILEDLINIGTTAPSGSNCQAWTFTVFPTKKKVKLLGEKIGQFFKNLNKLCENTFLRKSMALLGKKKLQYYYINYYEKVKQAIEQYEAHGVDKLFHGACAVIMVGGYKSASCPSEDALLATQNILLGAHAMGIGTCLIGYAVKAIENDKNLQSDLGIDNDQAIYSVIALGYPKESYQNLTVRKKIVPQYITLNHP